MKVHDYKYCPCCGKPFTPRWRGVKRVYCNELCKAKAGRIRNGIKVGS